MKTTLCGRMQEQLLLFLAGELGAVEAVAVRDHLKQCPECSAFAEQMAQLEAQVGSALRLNVPAPTTLAPRVMATVRRLPARRPFWPKLELPASRPARLGWAAAGLCLLLTGYLTARLMQPSGEPGGPGTSVAVGTPTTQLQLTALSQDYVSWLNTGQTVSVPGSDARDVSSRMMQKQRSLVPVVPVTFATPGTQIVGGCWHKVQGMSLAFMSYSWSGQNVSLYQTAKRNLSLPPTMQRLDSGSQRCYQVAQQAGLSYVAWGAGETQYILIARDHPEHLLGLARTAQGMS